MVDPTVARISGPVVVAKDLDRAQLFDIVRIGEMGLVGEIIRLEGNSAMIQVYEDTNNSESLRLAVNNTNKNNIMFFHGDLYFNDSIFKNIDFKKSFLVIDRKDMMKSKEIGVTIQNNKATILSYGLPTKWCQTAFITGRELKILRSILSKLQGSQKKMLSFEIINKMISMGANFECYEPNDMSIVEIDCIKDLKNENFNL